MISVLNPDGSATGKSVLEGAELQAALTTIVAAVTATNQAGLGPMAAVPAATPNGAALGVLPAGATGARFYLGAGDSISFTVASAAPGSAPSATFTISGAAGGTGPNWDENLAAGQMIYITAKTGNPVFRWI